MITITELMELSEGDLEELRINVSAEVSRRSLIDTAEAVLSDLNQRVLNARGMKSGDAWRQPSGAHDAYSKGWKVRHDGKLWESLTSGNAHAPGVSGWREVVEPGAGPAAWVQPSGAHDAYSVGDLVKHKGKTWRNIHPGARTNVWEPGVFGWEIDMGGKGTMKRTS